MSKLAIDKRELKGLIFASKVMSKALKDRKARVFYAGLRTKLEGLLAQAKSKQGQVLH